MSTRAYCVARVRGDAGCEKTIWKKTVQADSAAGAIRTCLGEESDDWLVEERGGGFASASNAKARRLYCDCLIAELEEA